MHYWKAFHNVFAYFLGEIPQLIPISDKAIILREGCSLVARNQDPLVITQPVRVNLIPGSEQPGYIRIIFCYY